MGNALTTTEKWEKEWKDFPLPAIEKPPHDLRSLLETHLPAGSDYRLIEIGCAPGRWMAYFSRSHGYSVAGIEYGKEAADLTRRNMKMQGIPAEVLAEDFFRADIDPGSYDVVFSGGFIEHFRDLPAVVERICALSRRYVVTLVPNLYGVNGLISKAVRPAVYAEHTPIDRRLLERLHAGCGVETLFCNYVGGARLIMPGAKNAFFEKHRWCGRALNAPVRVFNRLSEAASRALGTIPRSRLLSDSLLYIGKKTGP
ncbi:MAG: class I SAM-dependent methyltransferase [PVC group bacterium]